MAANASTGTAEAPPPALHELNFAQFVEAIRPAGAVNRLPQMPGMPDVLLYTVHFNGESAQALPENVQDLTYEPLALHKLTTDLGLNADTFRDTVAVSELMALRRAYMETVAQGAAQRSLDGTALVVRINPEVVADYERLVRGLDHPWIQERLETHKARVQRVAPVLSVASAILGKPVADQPPFPVNHGPVVARNDEFTVQALDAGGEVTHDNSQLDRVLAVGQNVSITYYRGQGQVFGRDQNVELSPPYLDEQSDDLAIKAVDKDTGKAQVLLFSGVSAFAHFAKAQGLASDVVKEAVDVVAKKLEQRRTRPPRVPELPPELDATTGAIVLNYKEGAARYSALFDTEQQLRRLAPEFGLSADDERLQVRLPEGLTLEGNAGPGARLQRLATSRADVIAAVQARCGDVTKIEDPNLYGGRPYKGQALAASEFHVAQDLGLGKVMIHSKFAIDKIPDVGNSFKVEYQSGRGRVDTRPKDRSAGHGR